MRKAYTKNGTTKKPDYKGKRFISANSLISKEDSKNSELETITDMKKQEGATQEKISREGAGENVQEELSSNRRGNGEETRKQQKPFLWKKDHDCFAEDILREVFEEEEDDDNECSASNGLDSISHRNKKYSSYYEFAIDFLSATIAEISDDDDDDGSESACSDGNIRLSQ
mmetsp:Transcript_21121/g.31897  ORF Transcript_21121/g.31897 Transcript_21121/m.31897 type:complete len:171 (-) Transcript_21121:116-628(-)|eukprot:CAMPEP_0178915382 /NCGR_PEP_ID=MMETSP0786-20121207/11995_1 /TAXON_ID=186022 /ORGANISM="Thalassionema frauenfeldii, Strain CCMP 1798" /LENGTH=170 /DNA_ID=CAMNT_0020588485 /DNA_START=400 /DNA_END=912 /DNA_ORIENTATION=+